MTDQVPVFNETQLDQFRRILREELDSDEQSPFLPGAMFQGPDGLFKVPEEVESEMSFSVIRWSAISYLRMAKREGEAYAREMLEKRLLDSPDPKQVAIVIEYLELNHPGFFSDDE